MIEVLLRFPALSLLPGHKPAQEHMCSAFLKWLMSVPISAMIAQEAVMLLFHSDRGVTYTNRQFKTMLDKLQATQSMSRPSCCIDNGPMEGFWGILKAERYYLQQFHTFEELQ